jgi:chromosome segregation ATPase
MTFLLMLLLAQTPACDIDPSDVPTKQDYQNAAIVITDGLSDYVRSRAIGKIDHYRALQAECAARAAATAQSQQAGAERSVSQSERDALRAMLDEMSKELSEIRAEIADLRRSLNQTPAPPPTPTPAHKK